MNDLELEFIEKTFNQLLGPPIAGAVVHCRFMDSETILDMCRRDQGPLAGWYSYGVGNFCKDGARIITTDQAVELRENKNEPILLLVERQLTGAGMDGISSSGRVIEESLFYKSANELVRKSLDWGSKRIAKKAVEKAKKVAGTKHISPAEIFSFYSKCFELKAVGPALGYLGLWPVMEMGKLEESELEKSAKMVEKLFLSANIRVSTKDLVDELMLDKSSVSQKAGLLDILRQSEGMSWKDSANLVTQNPELWLNRLRPGIFDLENLHKIEIVPWRSAGKKPAAWSGLSLASDLDMPELVIDRDSPKRAKSSKIEIRWKTLPGDLVKGSCDYIVEIFSGNEILAENRISHSAKNPQKMAFTVDDFDRLDDNSKFEAKVRVKAIGDQQIEEETEDFILRFGVADQKSLSTSANEHRSMVEAAIAVESQDEFEKMIRQHDSPQYYGRDKKGYITLRSKPRSGKVFCPTLIHEIETDWAEREGSVGRWKIKIRSDGERIGRPEFVGIDGDSSSPAWSRLSQMSRKISNLMNAGQGMVGMVYGQEKGIEDYINSWIEATENGDPSLALIGTIEVKSSNDKTLGLIVLPINPVRMAWHQGYDMLIKHARYELKMSASRVREVCRSLDGANCPAYLPGTEPDRSFLFGDILNFYFVAMVLDNDREPKASVAMMAKALVEDRQFVAQSVAQAAADSLATEVSRYAHLHDSYDTLHIHAFHPGDSMTLGRALGKSLVLLSSSDENDDETEKSNDLGFVLELFPSDETSLIAGQFFFSVVESSRGGVNAYAREDKWITENRYTAGGISRPKLIWAKRKKGVPVTTAHLAIAFDTFESNLKAINKNEIINLNNPLEVFGLVLNRQRIFSFEPEPNWKTFVNLELEGEKHPVSRTLTERLLRAHRAALQLTATKLKGQMDSLPFLFTGLSREAEESIADLHSRCDWVITIDRNAGIEYFDSPKQKSEVYDAYIIECVPEREDLGFLQLVTSTSNFDEISVLLDEALATMGVSTSPQNCVFLMNQLKSLSGRFAMRLAEGGNVAQEMVALAYTNAKCSQDDDQSHVWPSLKRGFFVPIDDVPQLLGKSTEESPTDRTRSDLLYVTASSRGGLQFIFIEIKYRRYLRTARSNDITDHIFRQLKASRQKWKEMYGDDIPEFTKTVNRSRLSRILAFYAEKGLRHNLEKDAYDNITREIKRMLREGSKYSLQKNDEPLNMDRGFIFCPEYLATTMSDVSKHGGSSIWLYGPNSVLLPSMSSGDLNEHDIGGLKQSQERSHSKADEQLATATDEQNISTETDQLEKLKTQIVLGQSDFQDIISWEISIKSNPHLMIVGLPGMGKTTCLLNLCLQMVKSNISPIIFSYHEDIDQMLGEKLGESVNFVDYAGLGFNPLEVVEKTAHAYVDNVSMIRDIFKAIFPDLGDIQLGALRESLKRSYTDLGWAEFDGKTDRPPLPLFQTFYDDLTSSEKKDAGLITRLTELNDYDLFLNTSEATSLLEINKPSVIRIHRTQNETLQKAFSTFVLFNIYKRMFQRGPASRITHAIIFDEAHRAANLKLIPRMIKECRKFGIAFVLASQEAKDFDPSIFSAIANYMVLRVSENDSKVMSKVLSSNEQAATVRDRLKRLPKYKAFFNQEGLNRPIVLALKNI